MHIGERRWMYDAEMIELPFGVFSKQVPPETIDAAWALAMDVQLKKTPDGYELRDLRVPNRESPPDKITIRVAP